MIVKYQKPIEFINNCNCIVDYKELERAILWYQDRPSSRLRKIYLYGKYPCITIFKEKIHVHRLLVMYWQDNKNIDKYVHHIDNDKLNCSKSNLKQMNIKEHQSYHNKGKKISEEHKKKIIKYNKSRKKVNRDKKGRFIKTYIHEEAKR